MVYDKNESIIKAVAKVYKKGPHYACIGTCGGNIEKNLG